MASTTRFSSIGAEAVLADVFGADQAVDDPVHAGALDLRVEELVAFHHGVDGRIAVLRGADPGARNAERDALHEVRLVLDHLRVVISELPKKLKPNSEK